MTNLHELVKNPKYNMGIIRIATTVLDYNYIYGIYSTRCTGGLRGQNKARTTLRRSALLTCTKYYGNIVILSDWRQSLSLYGIEVISNIMGCLYILCTRDVWTEISGF